MATRFVFLLICALCAPLIAFAQDGANLYQRHCASCHEASGQTRAPARTALRELTPERIVYALESIANPMSNQGLARTPGERRALAAYLSAKPFGTEKPPELDRIGCKQQSKFSKEEGSGSVSDYECCTFRGSVAALDAATGRQIWKTYTIPNNPAL